MVKSGKEYLVGRGLYGLNPRGQIMGETRGMLKQAEKDAAAGDRQGAMLELESVHKSFHDGESELQVLDGVDLGPLGMLHGRVTLAGRTVNAALWASGCVASAWPAEPVIATMPPDAKSTTSPGRSMA